MAVASRRREVRTINLEPINIKYMEEDKGDIILSLSINVVHIWRV